MGRIGTTVRACVGCGKDFEAPVYLRSSGYRMTKPRCPACTRARVKGERGLSPLELKAGGVSFRLVASAYPRVLIDAVGSLGQWDTGAFHGALFFGLRYGDMPPEVYRAAERALGRVGDAFWPKELRQGRIGA